MANYRIIVNDQVIPADDQVYHQVGEMPWRLMAGSPLRIAGRSYVVDRAEWNQRAQELVVTARRLGDTPAVTEEEQRRKPAAQAFGVESGGESASRVGEGP
jgi:hypothetical protein